MELELFASCTNRTNPDATRTKQIFTAEDPPKLFRSSNRIHDTWELEREPVATARKFFGPLKCFREVSALDLGRTYNKQNGGRRPPKPPDRDLSSGRNGTKS